MYDKEVKEAGRGHSLGSPHSYVAVAALEGMLAAEGAESSKQVVKLLMDRLSEQPRADTANFFRMFMVKLAREKEGEERNAKISFAINPMAPSPLAASDIPEDKRKSSVEIHMAICDLLRAEDTQTEGMGPATALERKVQANLQKATRK